MDPCQDFCHLLQEIGPGRRISRSAYDTAWVARLDELGDPVGEQALDWLRAHQLADGSWGASKPVYHHERVICTLAALTALAKKEETRDRGRLQGARAALETHVKGLETDQAGETIAFEMIVPALLAEAGTWDAVKHENGQILNRLSRLRSAKLGSLPNGTVNRRVTVSFSTEIVGPDGLHLLEEENLQAINGSVACSPSATAFFARYVRPQDAAALAYLHKFADHGAVPYVAPIGTFERAWSLWNLALAEPPGNGTTSLCERHLDYLEGQWEPGAGISSADGFIPDGDITSITYQVLMQFGRFADLGALLAWEKDEHFCCYELEANPSVSTNVHVLGALRHAGLGVEHPLIHKVLRFLRRTQRAGQFWFDKWHASPYYTTAHAAIACAGYEDVLAENAISWMLETQHADGAWGYYMPTAEETAYCLQALAVWKRNGGQVPDDALRRGAGWLRHHAEPPYPPLWIGKCLYTPEWVVRSAVLSALILTAQE